MFKVFRYFSSTISFHRNTNSINEVKIRMHFVLYLAGLLEGSVAQCISDFLSSKTALFDTWTRIICVVDRSYTTTPRNTFKIKRIHICRWFFLKQIKYIYTYIFCQCCWEIRDLSLRKLSICHWYVTMSVRIYALICQGDKIRAKSAW